MERLYLDRLNEHDIGDIAELYSDIEVTRYLGVEIANLADAQDWYAKVSERHKQGLGRMYAIRLLEGNELIGCCGFSDIDRNSHHGTITYSLARHYWGVGLMQEALRQLLSFAFEGGLACPIQRLQAWVNPRNGPSIRLLERMGFLLEGELRSIYFEKGQYVDLQCFGLLRTDQIPAVVMQRLQPCKLDGLTV
ncbi:GNAT family N-acetyltransferase [Chitinimonas arctica]|uniref:GNAT family N-acetyltransferase n=1 Tax=Chitinimonas arctica TaxID=2594795 RepID=A0A516S9P3_9NEIS|nr:GNAT family N-acetyltransferase [Chitinimonas arctica]QDQ24869.1 GNAT family N-acetyltransferase [Chitinimonas arctica]